MQRSPVQSADGLPNGLDSGMQRVSADGSVMYEATMESLPQATDPADEQVASIPEHGFAIEYACELMHAA